MDERTARGFAIYTTFHDSNGNRVRVQQSSAATEPKVWIFCHYPAAAEQIVGDRAQAHLTVDQAKSVRAGLDRFIAEATSA